MLLLMLWQPALSVATLRPQQNIVAVVADDSRSMAAVDNGVSRREQLLKSLNKIKDLDKKFQVRLYRAGGGLDRLDSPKQLNAQAPSTRLGDALKQVTNEAGSLPIGAVVLLSDGADNTGGIDLPTLSEIRRYRIPIHTVGFGREKLERDIEIVDAQMPSRVLADSRLAAQVTFKSFGYENRRVRLNIRDGARRWPPARSPSRRAGRSRRSPFCSMQARRNQNPSSNARASGRRGEQEQQFGYPAGVRGSDPAAHPLYRRRAEMGIQVHPPRYYEDQSLQLTTILRTTQNKIYRQGIDSREISKVFQHGR